MERWSVDQYQCGERARNPMNYIGFGAMDVTIPYEFIWFGDIHGPKPYKFIGFRWASISQTPAVWGAGPNGSPTGLVHVFVRAPGRNT